MSFEAKQASLTTTLTKVVDAADFDRVVTLLNGNSPRISFDGTNYAEVTSALPFTVTLPQGKDLWLGVSSPITVSLIVSR